MLPLPGDYATTVTQAATDLGGRPAAFGFHILDEPGKAEFQGTCDGVRITKKAAPHARARLPREHCIRS